MLRVSLFSESRPECPQSGPAHVPPAARLLGRVARCSHVDLDDRLCAVSRLATGTGPGTGHRLLRPASPEFRNGLKSSAAAGTSTSSL